VLKGAMFLREEDCLGEVKDINFVVEILIAAIEQVGLENVVQVIIDDAHVCKVAGLIVEGRYNHMIWNPCIVHHLNMILEEIEAKIVWIKEVTSQAREGDHKIHHQPPPVIGQAREIIKFITDHHQSQAIYREFSKLELLKVAKTRYVSNFIMLRHLVEVKPTLMSMVVGMT
jgi:hypothetical protein